MTMKEKLKEYNDLRRLEGGDGYLDKHPKLLALSLIAEASDLEARAILDFIQKILR